jgi:hypothetical protein
VTTPAEVVLGFLLEVRSGARPDRADRYLAPRVLAHQGAPDAERGVVPRSPGDYARPVRDMLDDVGPWTFEVTGVTGGRELVEATWRQTGAVVEHGRAWYRVERGRIREYWIEFRREPAVQPASSGRKFPASALQGTGGALPLRHTGADHGSRP